MRKISIMVSSVIDGLQGERDAIKEAFKDIPFVELIGATPFNNTATSGSSSYATLEMARNCDLYILILSEKYGYKVKGDKSATEAEYDEAIKDDPTKILVFLRDNGKIIEKEQQEFINRVSNYYDGYFRPTFQYTHQLKDMAIESFAEWLKNRAELGNRLTVLDHFIRTARQILPSDTAKVYYRTTEDYVEFEYHINGSDNTIQFSNREVSNNFWGCINELQVKCDEWSK